MTKLTPITTPKNATSRTNTKRPVKGLAACGLFMGSFCVAMSFKGDPMNRPQAARPLTGRLVFVLLVAFFGVVIGVNLVMMKLAIQTLPGTEVDSAYSASLAYEGEIAAAHDQNARNWEVNAHVQRDPEGGATVQVEA